MIFAIGTDGSGYTHHYEFAGTADDGGGPYLEAPLLVGSTVYGMTYHGGDGDIGVVYRLD